MTSPSTANAKQVFYERVLNNLPSGYARSDVKQPNKPFNTPNNQKWLRVSVIDQDVNNVQAGGKWLRYDALMVVDVFYPKNLDTIAQLTDAETVAALFENQSFGGADSNDVKCHEVLIQEIGEEESWYHVQVNITATYEGSRL
jgi:hypothetical protein